MKILFIANSIVGEEPGLTGGEVRFIEIAKTWANQGHQIHLMSSQSGKILCQRLGLNIILHSISQSKRTERFTFILRTLKSLFFLPRPLKDFDQGIVYSANEMIFDVVPALKLKLRNRKRIKWACAVHWLPPFPPWKRKKSSILNSILFFINERLSLWLASLFADVLLPISRMSAEQMQRTWVKMSKVYPVECGVNYNKIRNIVNEVREKKHDAVFIKRLQAVKGIFDLIEIWEMVVEAKPDAKLLVIGEGIDGQRARRIVKDKGLDKNIEFCGVIYELNEKIKKIAESKIAVLPSYEENWAIVIGETMACGTPLIAYGLAELIDVWKDNFIQVSVGDKTAFAQQVIALLDSPSTLNEISCKGSEYVKKYDWQAIAENELKIILGKI